MGIIVAAVLLSLVVVVPTFTGLLLSGRGAVLRFVGALLVLPLVGVWVWLVRNLIWTINVGRGDGWTELSYFLMSLALGVVGAIIGGIGRALAGR